MLVPIISCQVLENKSYRVAVTLGNGRLENLVITSDGLYSIYYIRDGKSINHTGRITNIVQNKAIPKNNYIVFDHSEDNSNRRERIYFYQIQHINDVTPNDAYRIALKHGFVGTVEDWLESMRGLPGKNAYELAVDCGFTGTLEEWLESLKGTGSGGEGSGSGAPGLSAYQIAVQNGFEGTETEWLESLKGRPGATGMSAYQFAIQYGFVGTEEEWLASLKGDDGRSAYEIAVDHGFAGSESDWLLSLQGLTGKSAYEIAIDHGFEGTEEDWMAANGDITAIKQDVDTIKSTLSWSSGMTT